MNKLFEVIHKLSRNINIKSITYRIDNIECNITYHKTLCDIKTYNKFFIEKINKDNIGSLDSVYPGIYFKITCIDDEIISLISTGFLLFQTDKYIYYVNVQNNVQRSISDSVIDPINIFGSRDGFVEGIDTNIALIQKRMKCETFQIEKIIVGKRSKTTINLCFVKDICNKETINHIIKKLNTLNTDAVLSVNDITYLFSKNSLFPKCAEIGSPEIAAMNLYEGRAVILIDQLPIAISLPVDFNYFISSKEINYTTPTVGFYYRILTYILLFISVFFLGIYASIINYHTNNISLIIISQIKSSFKGSTLPLFVEFLFIILLFDTLRLASTKSPDNNIQNIIAIVGGLLIGQNAVNSGFISAFNLVITAICYISSYAISSNQRFIQAIAISRIIVLASGLFLGLFGVLISFILLFNYLQNMSSINSPYFSPISPFRKKDFSQLFFTKRIFKRKTRNKNLFTIDETRGN